jgi:exopolyphosphatase/guanosine-5'-triphosphate,3'-diphosphate pyrophosphatase
LRALQREMRALTPVERRRMPGMNPRRSDIIVAGNAIVMGVLEALGRDELIVCERALREGVVVDYLERNIAVARKLGDERTRRLDAAHALAERFGTDEVHGSQVGSLALELFDGLSDLHGFEPAERDVLFAAAILHDVGRAISPSAHHKHSAYIVRNAGLPGWRPDEITTIAALVRYHRKSLPKPAHPEWASASPELRRKILGLGALLRIADGLDRRRLGLVNSLGARHTQDAVVVRVHAQQDVTPELEAAAFKADLFERAFAQRPRFEAAPAGPFAADFGESEPNAEEVDAASLPG